MFCTFFDDAPVEEVDLPVSVTGEAGVVRDHADRRAFPVQLDVLKHRQIANEVEKQAWQESIHLSCWADSCKAYATPLLSSVEIV